MAKKGDNSKYDPKYIKLVDVYLKQCKDNIKVFHKTRGEKSDSYERILKVNLPTKEGYSRFIGFISNTVTHWEMTHPNFATAMRKIQDAQKEQLLNKGLGGEYNPTIVNFILSANHGMKTQSELKVITNTLTEEQQARLDKLLDGK